MYVFHDRAGIGRSLTAGRHDCMHGMQRSSKQRDHYVTSLTAHKRHGVDAQFSAM
jgi:hypothetical protein